MGAGLTPENLGNDSLAPEKSLEIEVGAEFGFFDNTMGIEATYWHRKTTDALVDMQFPLSGGFSNFQLINRLVTSIAVSNTTPSCARRRPRARGSSPFRRLRTPSAANAKRMGKSTTEYWK